MIPEAIATKLTTRCLIGMCHYLQVKIGLTYGQYMTSIPK